MAIFHLTVKRISRGAGQSAIAKAAYNNRCKLVDERTGSVKDYEKHGGEVLFSGIFAPKDAPDWVQNRQVLWNAAEGAERRKDSLLAIEIEVALPHEFSDEQRKWLVTDFVREQFSRKGIIADVNIHKPDENARDERNDHAHILLALRTAEHDGFGKRAFNCDPQQVEQWRESWENTVNRHLERHGFEERIDRRTLEDQGIDREPTRHRGPHIDAMERKGIETERAAILTQMNGELRLAVGLAREESKELRATTEREDITWWRQQTEMAGGRTEALGAAQERVSDGAQPEKGWNEQLRDLLSLEQTRELRRDIIGMRELLRDQLSDSTISQEHRASLREISNELREMHFETTSEINALRGLQPAFERVAGEAGVDYRAPLEAASMVGSKALDIAGAAAEKMGDLIGELADSFAGRSLPTPEVIHARREAAEEKAVEAEKGWKRSIDDDVRGRQRAEEERIKREQEESAQKRAKELELHPKERERER